MVERLVRIQEVRGSIPLISTKQVLDEHLLFQAGTAFFSFKSIIQ